MVDVSPSRRLVSEPARPSARALRFVGDDAALAEGLKAGNPAARAELFERHAPHIRRVLLRVLGPDGELEDALHDVFVEAFRSVYRLDDPTALRAWLTTIAVFTARGHIRRRHRRRWLRFVAPSELPEIPARDAGVEVTEAVRRAYAVLDRLDADERIAFALRFVEGMELEAVARACDVSLATIKRRISRAVATFRDRAARDPALSGWLREET